MASYLEYMHAAMNRAKAEQLPEGEWYMSIPGFDGLWATGETVEEARQQLFEALDGWLVVHIVKGKNRAPVVDGVTLCSEPQRVA